jgi:hypothetical protein
LGEGIGNGERGKGSIVKDSQGFLLKYVNTEGEEYFLRLGEDGIYLGYDLTHIALYPNGMITSYANNTTQDWNWVINELGQITQIVNNTLFKTINLSWSATPK